MHASKSRSSLLMLAVGASVVALAVLLLRTAWGADDAYISFRTIHNLLEGHGLRWNVAERVQSYTHPLWLLVVAAIAWTGLDPFFASLLAAAVATLTIPVVLASRVGPGPGRALLAVTLLASSKAFMDFSVSGLENPLTNILLVVFMLVSLSEDRDGVWHSDLRPADRLTALTALAALLCLTRLDAALLVAPSVAVLWSRYGVRRGLARVCIGSLPLLTWEAFSLIYYGDWIPNTARAKLGFEAESGVVFAIGRDYLLESVRLDPAMAVVCVAGVISVIVQPTRLRGAAAAAALLYMAYIVSVGGDFMAGRFFVAPTVVLVILLVSSTRLSGTGGVALGALVVGVSLLSPVSPYRTGPQYGVGDHTVDGVIDERAFYYQRTGLLTNHQGDALVRRYVRAPMSWDGGPVDVQRGGGGFEPYEGGPGIHCVDAMGLTDPLLSRLVVRPQGDFRPGHLMRKLPLGYLASLRTGETLLLDPGTASLHDDVRIVTRGPLWTRERWRAIWRLHTHDYQVEAW